MSKELIVTSLVIVEWSPVFGRSRTRHYPRKSDRKARINLGGVKRNSLIKADACASRELKNLSCHTYLNSPSRSMVGWISNAHEKALRKYTSINVSLIGIYLPEYVLLCRHCLRSGGTKLHLQHFSQMP
jgi:hypothetical protein